MVPISPEGVAIVAFIKRTQESGFTLAEIGTICHLLSTHSLNAADARARVENKVRQIEERIQSLQVIRNKLSESLKTCACSDGRSLCPNLKSVAESMEHV